MEILLDVIEKELPEEAAPAALPEEAAPAALPDEADASAPEETAPPVRTGAPNSEAKKPKGPKQKKSHPKAKKIVLRALACLLALVLLLSGAVLLTITHNWKESIKTYVTDNPFITPYGDTLVSAHRSGGGIFPENTMMAFEGCISSETFRTDIFEFDLHITKDGALILLHDDTLDRTTDSETVFGEKGARPENYTLEELQTLNFGAGFADRNGDMPFAALAGDAVPENLRAATLDEILAYLEANGDYRYIIEIKNGGDLGRQAVDVLYGVLKEKGLLEKVIVGTFKKEITAYMDTQYPDLQRSASVREVIGFYLDCLRGKRRPEGYYRFTALQIPANQFVIKLGNAKLVNFAHRHNIAMQYWTINDPADMVQLKNVNADCIMSDVPDVAYAALRSE